MNNDVRKVIKNVKDVSFDENEEYIIIGVFNTMGEDFEFEIEKSNTKQEVEDIIRECEIYDVDEHFSLWWGADRGEPSSVRVLLENCEEIGDTLDNLQSALYKWQQEHRG